MRILFLVPRLPYPPFKGDQLRAFHQIRELAARHEVHLAAFAVSAAEEANVRFLSPYCRNIHVIRLPRWRSWLQVLAGLFSADPLQAAYYRSPAMSRLLREALPRQAFDLVHVQMIRMLPYLDDLDGLPVVFDLIDSLALNMSARADAAREPWRRVYALEHARVRLAEQEACRRARAALVTTARDHRLIGHERLEILPNGVDTGVFRPLSAAKTPGSLVFLGNMGYFGNTLAASQMARGILPLIRREEPGARLSIIGLNPTPAIRRLAGPHVEVTGFVPDAAAALASREIAVCPMWANSGMPNKVLEYLACGLPVVATPNAVAGIDAMPERDFLLAETPESFARAVVRLLRDPELRAHLGRNGRGLMVDHYQWDSMGQRLEAIYERAVAPKRHPGAGRDPGLIARPETALKP